MCTLGTVYTIARIVCRCEHGCSADWYDDGMSDEIIVDSGSVDYASVPIKNPDWSKMPSIKDLYSPGYVVTMSESGQLSDYHTIAECERAIDECRIAVFKVSEMIDDAERKYRRAKLEYDRRLRRAYLAAVAPNEQRRHAIAEMQVETPYENHVVMCEQYLGELKRRLRNIVNDLDALSEQARNIRKEMGAQ